LNKHLLLLIITIWFSINSNCQNTDNDKKYKLHIKKAVGKMVLDGKLDEADWKNANIATDFWQGQPYDSSRAINQTEARMTFDNNYLYISGVCYQPRKYVVLSLKRDFGGGTTDIFGVNLDTFKDKLNSFNFAVSPLGVQRDGLVSNGNELSTDWDNKWYSKVINYEDRWEVEMAIPFKTIRYKVNENDNEWLVNFTRFDQSQKFPERSSWGPIPRNFNGNNINFSGTVIWDSPPPKPGANISIIPYILGALDKDFQNKKDLNTDQNIGFDAKIAVTPSLNLDITVNPDFAQVEVDQQVQNLSRFEVSFPEKRQFFIENADLFGSFGFDNITPFFSRRVGLAYNAKTDQNERVPILLGTRLSGRLNKDWRIGFLTMQTGSQENFNLPSSNYLVTAIQRRIFSRSNIGFIFTNKQNWLFDTLRNESGGINANDFTRIVGLDYNLNSPDGKWSGKMFYHRAIQHINEEGQYAGAAYLAYDSPNFATYQSVETVGKNYDIANQTGYVTRTNYFRTEPNAVIRFYPKSQIINTFGFGVDGDFYWRINDKILLDYDFSPIFFNVRFQNSAQLRLTPYRINYTYLFGDFDPTRKGQGELKAGTEYTYSDTRINFISNARRKFHYSLQGRVGDYFGGTIQQIHTILYYRYQPYGVFSFDASYNKITQPYGASELILLRPKFDLSFSRNVFFSSLVQYNNLSNNLSVNTRLQWRFKPASDFFMVYTDNYYASDTFSNDSFGNRYLNNSALQTKNRAIVFKLTYWFNV
jgi:Domain of unknown function (DUF5916)